MASIILTYGGDLIENITNRKYTLTRDIQNLVEMHDISYMDAIIMYCDENGLELDSLAETIKEIPILFSHIEEEAESLNYIKKHSRLKFE